MDTNKESYIIVEIIPTTSTKATGEIAQLSALKLNGIQLVDRFDFRLNPNKIKIPDIIEITSYDKESFQYLETTNDILSAFDKWANHLPLLILDNSYTKDYLKDLSNEKISISSLFDMEYSDDMIDILMDKYHLEPSNYIVDLLYESIIRLEKK